MTTRTLAKNCKKTTKRAFTLIEMTIVITILLVFAAAIMPNLYSMKKSRETRQFFSKARDLLADARERSIADGVARHVRYEESGSRLIVERTNADSGEQVEDRTLSLPDGTTATAFRLEKNDSNSGEWSLGFYPDGHSEGGDIQFSADGEDLTLEVSSNGHVQILKGDMPDISQKEWDAGGYEQRI